MEKTNTNKECLSRRKAVEPTCLKVQNNFKQLLKKTLIQISISYLVF